MKILLHACCGPCSLEPVRLLASEGHQLAIAYANSNIHPQSEYLHRLETLLDWARSVGLQVIEGPYDVESWMATAGKVQQDGGEREMRCRMCYRGRLEWVAAYAAEHGFDGIGSTLTVSPYQYTQVIAEEIQRACQPYGLTPVFRDFRPYYQNATDRSRAMGMYRQNYCGCAYSAKEAEDERQERKLAREAEKARKAALRAQADAELERQRREKAARQAEYDRKQQAKKEMRKRIRAQMKAQEAQADQAQRSRQTPADKALRTQQEQQAQADRKHTDQAQARQARP